MSVMGRPPKYDYIKEAKDLDEWSKLDTSIALYEFTDMKSYLASQLGEFASVSEEFSASLKKSKERISLRRERMVCSGKIKESVYHRSARLYDRLLKDQEDKDKDDDAERKLKIVAATPVNPMTSILQSIDGKTEELVGRSADK